MNPKPDPAGGFALLVGLVALAACPVAAIVAVLILWAVSR